MVNVEELREFQQVVEALNATESKSKAVTTLRKMVEDKESALEFAIFSQLPFLPRELKAPFIELKRKCIAGISFEELQVETDWVKDMIEFYKGFKCMPINLFKSKQYDVNEVLGKRKTLVEKNEYLFGIKVQEYIDSAEEVTSLKLMQTHFPRMQSNEYLILTAVHIITGGSLPWDEDKLISYIDGGTNPKLALLIELKNCEVDITKELVGV